MKRASPSMTRVETAYENGWGWIKVPFMMPGKLPFLPMSFCYPGTGKAGDLPPRLECAETWRAKLLAHLPNLKLTLMIGKYAHDYHIHDSSHTNVSETVRAWKEFWPERLPLPHPSPRNNIWLKRNPWFATDLLPTIRKHIQRILQAPK